MIFLAATKPCSLKVYDADFYLEPLTYPEINTAHILAMESALANRILKTEDQKINPIKFEAERLPGFPRPFSDPDQIPAGSRIMVMRGGGIGDVLMCTPVIRELRKRLPSGTHISLATFKSNIPLFEGNPNIDSVTSQPLTLGDLMEVDFYVEFALPDSLMSSLNMTDYYFRCLDIEPEWISAIDKKPCLNADRLMDKELIEYIRKTKPSFKNTIYLNGLSSDLLRDISPEILSIFPENFKESLFLLPRSYYIRHRNICTKLISYSNIHLLDTEDSLSRYITAIASSDIIITADSSAYHIAAALDKPSLAFFGPIQSDLRTTYYPTVSDLEQEYQGIKCSSPCGKSMLSEFRENPDPEGKVCPEAFLKGTRFSPCLNSFSEEYLIKSLMNLLDSFNIQYSSNHSDLIK